MGTEKKKKFLINFLYFIVVIAIAGFACRVALPALWPFLVAWVVAIILRPVVEFLRTKLKFGRGLSTVIPVLLFYALIGSLVALISIRLVVTAKRLLPGFPAYYNNTIEPLLINLTKYIKDLSEKLNPEAGAIVTDFLAGFGTKFESTLTQASMTLLKSLTSVAVSVPTALLHILIMIIATAFIASDYPILKKFVRAQCSERTNHLLDEIRIHLGRTIGRYLKSYALIMLITFGELSLGLLIIGVKNPFLIAALIAILDILPVVGSGTVLIPWAIISLLQQNYVFGIKLLVVYIIITVIRNIIEPKIVGNHVGMHPVVTLSAMVVGTYVFGPIGLLGLPVTIALLKSLNDEGVIHLFKYAKEDPETDGQTSKKDKGQDKIPEPAANADPEPEKPTRKRAGKHE